MEQNKIPPMTHPLCKAWDQPNTNEFLIENDTALMTKVTLNKFKNYSHSIPSGVYEGKMWRSEFKGINYLNWYSTSDDPNKCSVNSIEIILID